MNSLSELQVLEVKDIIEKIRSKYCEEHCKEAFVSHRQLNKTLYIIGTVIVILAGAAVGWALPTATSLGAQAQATIQLQRDMREVKYYHSEIDSTWQTIKKLENKLNSK